MAAQRTTQHWGDPMDLDVIRKDNKRKPFTTEQQKRFQDGSCLGCGKKGHYARECPHKTKQFNMINQNQEKQKAHDILS